MQPSRHCELRGIRRIVPVVAAEAGAACRRAGPSNRTTRHRRASPHQRAEGANRDCERSQTSLALRPNGRQSRRGMGRSPWRYGIGDDQAERERGNEINDGDSAEAQDEGTGKLRSGLRIFPTGESANSKPVSANRHNAEADAILPKGGRRGRRSFEAASARHAEHGRDDDDGDSGRTLISTVTKLSSPAALIPRRLTRVRTMMKARDR